MTENQNNRIPGCRVMSKEGFWNLIAEVNDACGQDQDKYMDMLKARLKEQGPEYAQDFHDAVHAYEDLAYKYGLWSAVRLMGHATDDGFTDFRAWLISQGKEAYFAALKEPDTLADLDPGDGYWFESFAYAGYYALKELTGEDAFDNMSEITGEMIEEALKADIEYGEGINYPYEAYDLPNYFPRLFQKSVINSPEPRQFNISNWNSNLPKLREAKEGGPPPRPQNKIEMGGM